ncbi:extracellular solute-binding protein [Streptomyces sp. NRRL B-24484]|uniref:extracellular solute-binding protein n=1 Tax=Streptomyces sp. NRRL B-24484 TaxID=1463833 RepID=UPI000B1B1922|nr:extracellular solute-binding protein [Streptomyces sp. NRRL B-24484]
MNTLTRTNPLRACRVLAPALVLVLATGCGAFGSGDGGGDVTLRLVAADYGDSEANSSSHFWGDLIGRFEEANPGIKVELDLQSWNDIDKRVANLLASGRTPDLVQTGGFADQVAADRLYPATEVLSIDTQAGMIDAFSRAGQVLGSQYGIPFVASTRVFFYNKAVFAKAGITAPPTTWDELRHDAELIKAKVPGVTPYALPLGPEEAQAESMIWAMGGGGGLADNAGNYTFDSPQNRATFAWLRTNLVDKHLTYADPSTTDRKTAFNDFAAGKVAMLNGHPGLVAKATAAKIDYGTAAVPRKDATVKPATFGVADWMMAFKANGHRTEIKKFLGFLYRTDNQLAFDERYNLLPVTQETRTEMTGSGRHRDLAEFLNALPTANFYPYGDPSWDKVSGLVKQRIGAAVKRDGNDALAALQAAAATEAGRTRH